ncbi:MAG: urease accessory protein UreE [Bauldia sp.]
MLVLTEILGHRDDPAMRGRLHAIEHRGRVETLSLPAADMARRRVRGTTDAGTECAIAIARHTSLSDGAVLLIERDRAIVVRAEVERWIRLAARSAADALQLGYQAGNLHWRVRFDGADLLVALEGPADRFLARVRHLIDAGAVAVGDTAEAA